MENIVQTFKGKLSNAQEFCIGLKLLAKKCNISSIEYCKLGIISYKFKDGSEIGCIRAHTEAGLVNKQNK